MNTLFTIITAAIVSLGAVFGFTPEPELTPEIKQEITTYVQRSMEDSQVLGAVLPIAGHTYTLAGSGVSSSATSITLQSLTIKQTGQKIQDSDLSDTFYITLEPGSNSKQEIASCTTVVQNANGTATLSGCSRGLSPVSPYTASTTLRFTHAGGTQVIFSDPPQLFNSFAAKENAESITGAWTFSSTSMPKLDAYLAPTTTVQFVTKKYVDDTAFSGAGVIDATAAARGVVELATQLETASSSSSGSSGPLAIPASNATSTWNPATADLRVVVTQNSGKIDNNFIASSTLYATNFTFSGSTTTIAALNIATSSAYIGAFPAYHIGKNVQVITTTGTSTFAVPSGISKVYVRLVGGGGGGGNGSDDTSDGSGGGGGGGGYAEEMVDVTSTTTVQVFVGSGGSATQAGTWSTFGTNGFYLSATGGNAGTTDGAGGAGGIGSGGDMNIRGQTGGGGKVAINGTGNVYVPGGVGGSSHLGGGGSGGVGTDSTGGTGGVYGGGGGGGVGDAGGSGAQGIVIINW